MFAVLVAVPVAEAAVPVAAAEGGEWQNPVPEAAAEGLTVSA